MTDNQTAANRILSGLRDACGLSVITKRTSFVYRNWCGETAHRLVEPVAVWFGRTQWHPEMQWFMRAVDVEKQEVRDFAMKDMAEVTYE